MITLRCKNELGITNHKMVEVGWDFRQSFSLALIKAGSATAHCSGSCPFRCEYLQDWRFHHLFGQTIPAFSHHPYIIFFILSLNAISNVPHLTPLNPLDADEKSLALPYLLPTISRSLQPRSHQPSDAILH